MKGETNLGAARGLLGRARRLVRDVLDPEHRLNCRGQLDWRRCRVEGIGELIDGTDPRSEILEG